MCKDERLGMLGEVGSHKRKGKENPQLKVL